MLCVAGRLISRQVLGERPAAGRALHTNRQPGLLLVPCSFRRCARANKSAAAGRHSTSLDPPSAAAAAWLAGAWQRPGS